MLGDVELLRAAYYEARKSLDRSTQNGCVLFDPISSMVVALGHNDLHKTWKDTDERRTKRPDKYQWAEHAERAAIYSAARDGIPTQGLWMYCPWSACADCGRAIVFAGITRLVRHDIPEHKERPDWQATIEAADQMFREAGVEVVDITDRLFIKFRFHERIIEA